MKRFGYLREYLHFNIYNSTKMYYLKHPIYGNLELPKHPKNKKSEAINEAAANYAKRVDLEKYLNPKGYKPTITSNFPKPQLIHDFANIMLYRIPTNKNYGSGTLVFESKLGLSKPEVKQFLMKMYNLPVLTIHSQTINHKFKRTRHGYEKPADTKKWIVKIALSGNAKNADKPKQAQQQKAEV